jgi:hypothetical protein
MITLFPDFQRLELSHKPLVKTYTTKFPPYSDYNFNSIWSYNVENDIIISDLHDNLIVRFRDYITNEHFFSFIGSNEVISTAQMIMDYAVKANITPTLKLIPESTIQATPDIQNYFNVSEDFSNHDYIVSSEELSELRGEKHHKKAALSRQFSRLYPDHITKLLDLNQTDTHTHIYELFYTWEKEKSKNRSDTEHELTALKRILSDNSDLTSVGIYHQNKLISFMITEITHGGYALIHFMKTNPNYKGISEATHQANSRYLSGKGVKHINLEQDLGIEGLKNAKLQWHPTHFLKKYIISRKKI